MKEVTHIDCPKGFEIYNDYGSHRPLLWLALINSKGDVDELGCGCGSTRLLEAYCLMHGRSFTSWENDHEWYKKFKLAYGINVIIENYEGVYGISNPGLLFIDSKPGEQRKILIEQFSNNAQIIVVHDTEESAEYVYGMKEILSTFKYRLNFKPKGLPHTTAVSNFINVEDWT